MSDQVPFIRRAAGQCLKGVPLERKLRLLWVRIWSLALVEHASSATNSVVNQSKSEVEPGLF